MTPTRALHAPQTWVHMPMTRPYRLYTLVRSYVCSATQSARLQQSLTALHAWGQKWKVLFEPTKSQCMTISHHQPQRQLPSPVVGDQQVPHDHQLKLLGVLFDDRLSYRVHLRQVSLRANSSLGLLRKASKYLSIAGRITTYRGFVRPLLEYAPLAWMGVAPHICTKLIACNYLVQCREATHRRKLWKTFDSLHFYPDPGRLHTCCAAQQNSASAALSHTSNALKISNYLTALFDFKFDSN